MANGGQVPRWVTWIEPECFTDIKARKEVAVPGEQFLIPEYDELGRGINNVSLNYVVDDLISAGFMLVEAIAQERTPNKVGAPPYAMVRYTFYRNELAECAPNFMQNKANIVRDLHEFLELALWRVRGFRNLYFKQDGTVLDGASSISINMDARNPLYVANDKSKPQVRWQKDANGDRVGDAPLPVVAGSYVSVIDGEIALCVESVEVAEDDVVDSKGRTWSQVLRDEDSNRLEQVSDGFGVDMSNRASDGFGA